MARVAPLRILLATACTLAFAVPSWTGSASAQSSGGSSGGSASVGSSSGGGAPGGSASGGIGGTAGGMSSPGSNAGAPAAIGPNASSAPGGATATAPLDPNGTGNGQRMDSGTATGSATSSGTGGSSSGVAQRQQDPRCSEVLAHPDYFTTGVVQACQKQAGAAGSPTAQRDLSTGSLGKGLEPVDRPAEVQKQVEGSDNKAVDGICSNCK